jgi:hypothetical protein
VDEFLLHEVGNTNIQDVLHDYNDITPSLKFKIEENANNKIHFLDVIISRDKNNLQYTIYRKPTTNVITPKHTCHPLEFNLAGL